MMSTDDKDSLTTDIIARLRQEGSFPPYYGVPAIQNDAADEIERLRAENERLREALVKIAQQDTQAIAIDALRPGERIYPLEAGFRPAEEDMPLRDFRKRPFD